jgi:hypothetical protein
MYADRDYAPGTEIYWAYGVKANIELLFGYGFIIDRNLDDFITL